MNANLVATQTTVEYVEEGPITTVYQFNPDPVFTEQPVDKSISKKSQIDIELYTDKKPNMQEICEKAGEETMGESQHEDDEA